MDTITINLGGEGEPVTIPVTLRGCPCRTEDFLPALVKFASEWRQDAELRAARAKAASTAQARMSEAARTGEVKPCGACGGKKGP